MALADIFWIAIRRAKVGRMDQVACVAAHEVQLHLLASAAVRRVACVTQHEIIPSFLRVRQVVQVF